MLSSTLGDVLLFLNLNNETSGSLIWISEQKQSTEREIT